MARFRVRDQQGRIYGPIDAGELRPWITEGRLTEDMLLQQEGSADWYRAGDVPALAKIFAQRKAAMGSARAGTGAPRRAQEEPLDIQPDTSETLGANDDAASQSRPEDAEPAPPPPPNSPSSSPLNAESQSQFTEFPDRVLRGAFRFARWFSVLVIFLACLVVAGGVAVAAYALVPVPHIPASRDTPTANEFVAWCNQVVKNGHLDELRSSYEGRLNRVSSNAVGLQSDPCAMFQDRIKTVLRLLEIKKERFEEVVCDAVGDLPSSVHDDFLTELLAFAERFKELKSPANWCSAEDAVMWFHAAFRDELKAQRDREAEALAQRAARRALFGPAMSWVGTAIATVLLILFLPLLIQIERNTRLTAFTLEKRL